MGKAGDCYKHAVHYYRHAVQRDHLAKFSLSEADRDVMLAAAVNWRILARSAEEAENASRTE